MNKKIILSSIFLLFLLIFTSTISKGFCQGAQIIKPQAKQAQGVNKQIPLNTTALAIVSNPSKYLNKTVKIQATFDKFSTLGLDYNKALRKSNDYIGILIQRDDVIDHNIPLSEMKLFLKKDLAEKYIDLDTGDKIEIVAKEFSVALGDPWLDVNSINIIKKNKQEEK